MRLCFFGLNLTYGGGVENLSVNLIKHLAQYSEVDEIYVICEDVDEEVYRSLKHKKVNIQCIGRPKRSDLVRLTVKNIRYRNFSDELNRFDVFHILDLRAFPFSNINSHQLVVTIHDVMIDEFLRELKLIGLMGIRRLVHMIDHYPPQFLVEAISIAKAKRVIVNNHVIADRLRKLYSNVVADKIRIIPAGFDPMKFNPYFSSKSHAKQLLKLDPSAKVLLHVGGCKERKGLQYLLQAFDFMRKNGELDRLNILLLVLGRIGEKYSRLFQSIRKYVVELPYVSEDELPIVYKAADALVMPSTSEGWGISLIQAIACGTPVVASSHVPSAFATMNTGVVNIEEKVNSPTRLAKSILNKLNHDSSRGKDWDKIFSYLVLKYSWRKLAESQIDVYKEFMNKEERRYLNV